MQQTKYILKKTICAAYLSFFIAGCGGSGGEAGPSAQPAVYNVSGKVISNNVGLAGATLTITGTSLSAVSDSTGSFTFKGMQKGKYSITPTLAGYSFTPVTQAVTINDGDVTVADFTASATSLPLYAISGKVTLNNSGVSGIAITLSGETSGTAYTDANGTYSINGTRNGIYTLTATGTGYSATPPSIKVTVADGNVAGQDFTVTPVDTGSAVVTW